MAGTVKKYASLVKFSHTIFAFPFAIIGYVYALAGTGTPFDWLLFMKVALCMVFARNAAMGFNRWADRRIDAENPRTAAREIPAGRISPRAALIFVILNVAAFFMTCWFVNRLAFALAPVALFITMGYSYTKRFTAWSHIVLGVSLAIAPVGAYIAVTGTVAAVPIMLAAVVMTWVSGFDILYSMQDALHDRSHNLHSVPARFSSHTSAAISVALHVITVYAVILLGFYPEFRGGGLYWIGTAVFIALLACQHLLFIPSKTGAIGKYFTLLNGLSSFSYALFTVADILMR